ncbi:MAG: hypothetical protein ACI8ZB_002798 [Desulforhopalus sp.]|jgi:hypothetical protein
MEQKLQGCVFRSTSKLPEYYLTDPQDKHGGELSFASEIGVGTTFTIKRPHN